MKKIGRIGKFRVMPYTEARAYIPEYPVNRTRAYKKGVFHNKRSTVARTDTREISCRVLLLREVMGVMDAMQAMLICVTLRMLDMRVCRVGLLASTGFLGARGTGNVWGVVR